MAVSETAEAVPNRQAPGPSEPGHTADPAEDDLDADLDQEKAVETVTRAFSMVGTAIQFGLALMITLVMILVTGLFVTNVPMSGAFQSAMNTAIDIGGAGFIITAVSLLVVPVVGLVVYFSRSGLSSFIRSGGR